MKEYQVTAGIFIKDHKVLAFQRGSSSYSYIENKFEFPGGKIEPDESPEDCLTRELLEELSV